MATKAKTSIEAPAAAADYTDPATLSDAMRVLGAELQELRALRAAVEPQLAAKDARIVELETKVAAYNEEAARRDAVLVELQALARRHRFRSVVREAVKARIRELT